MAAVTDEHPGNN
uniref:Uncharacterized protein n=1 Tax=Anguilla anguilla TaxID=7936 RepID=A0A0E9PGQ8_ANGAN